LNFHLIPTGGGIHGLQKEKRYQEEKVQQKNFRQKSEGDG
jgi:hypothetical protein